MQLTEQQVLALAPDSSSAANGKKLMSASKWVSSGKNEQALWGECQGSGSKPYQTQIDLTDFASKCSCPSRKFPCKHALGLLLFAASDSGQIAASAPPEWVSAWLDKRTATAAKKEEKAAEKAAEPVDEEARRKRQDKREQRVGDGLAAFRLWLEDVIRQGIAGLPAEGPAVWEQQAARLVDAQAPALAARVRRISDLVGAESDWPQQVLSELGSIALAIHAWQQLPRLPDEVQSSLRQYMGFTVAEDEVLLSGTRCKDSWMLVAQTLVHDGHIRVQRNWLQGRQSGQFALLLQFAAPSQPMPANYIPGTCFSAELACWPGAASQRALLCGTPAALPAESAFYNSESIAQMLARMSAVLAQNPWTDRIPAVLQALTPFRDAAGNWFAADQQGQALALLGTQHWVWMAVSGGAPLDVAGEWDGKHFLPLACMADGCYTLLNEVHA
ncbi:SWIM zinc finger family protein [Undibacterium luofuense]|uniref:SWIM zinc finger family protein n=1 Tax=Undibacterium luofuense TaxID=2828733 RepID=A0A941DKF5_9BURK|nr:SWIM zinc finger family protein [Undibacterium luofuense]MBR7781590.1 SWIM zinc finger family protein [Undibacterium luofuense]